MSKMQQTGIAAYLPISCMIIYNHAYFNQVSNYGSLYCDGASIVGKPSASVLI